MIARLMVTLLLTLALAGTAGWARWAWGNLFSDTPDQQIQEPDRAPVDRWLDRPISLEYREIPLREALDRLCESQSCRWYVRGSGAGVEVVVQPATSSASSPDADPDCPPPGEMGADLDLPR